VSTDAQAERPRPGSNAAEVAPVVVETFPLGPFETNCYVVYEAPAAPGKPCWIVDASFEPGEMIERVRGLGLQPEKLILTHAHVDHIAGVDEVRRAFPNLPVLIHAAERDWLTDPQKNLSMAMGMPVTAAGFAGTLAEGDELTLGSSTWKVLHTPGHSPGSITLHNARDGIALAGDALFAGSIGRTDFPGSSFDQLARSIREKLYTLPDATGVYPGHGPATTTGREAQTNPFVRRG
jgi:hydroxyacylglutathione hydrolase